MNPVALLNGRILYQTCPNPASEAELARRPVLLHPAHVIRLGEWILACLIGQHAPGQRVVALTQPEKAPEAHDGIRDLPRALADHEVVNRAELLVLAVENRRTLDLVGGDQVRRLIPLDGAGRAGSVPTTGVTVEARP